MPKKTRRLRGKRNKGNKAAQESGQHSSGEGPQQGSKPQHAQIQPGSGSQLGTGFQLASRPQSGTGSQSGSRPPSVTVPQSGTASRVASQPLSATVSRSGTGSQSASRPQSGTGSQSGTVSQAASRPPTVTVSQSEIGSQLASRPKSVTVPKSGTVSQAASRPLSATVSQTGTGSQSASTPQSAVGLQSVSKTQSGWNLQSRTVPKQVAKPETGSKTQSGSNDQSGSKPNQGSKSKSKKKSKKKGKSKHQPGSKPHLPYSQPNVTPLFGQRMPFMPPRPMPASYRNTPEHFQDPMFQSRVPPRSFPLRPSIRDVPPMKDFRPEPSFDPVGYPRRGPNLAFPDSSMSFEGRRGSERFEETYESDDIDSSRHYMGFEEEMGPYNALNTPDRNSAITSKVQFLRKTSSWKSFDETKEIIVQSNRSDPPEICSVCDRPVPNLLRHANVLHLPWFVYAPSACSLCLAQCNDPRQQHIHSKTEHSNEETSLSPVVWRACMKEFMTQIAATLGLELSELPMYVVEKGLANRERTKLYKTDIPYYDNPEFWDLHPFDPSQPSTLRDCSHWRIILRLIAKASWSYNKYLVRSLFVRDGLIFLADNDDELARARGSRALKRSHPEDDESRNGTTASRSLVETLKNALASRKLNLATVTPAFGAIAKEIVQGSDKIQEYISKIFGPGNHKDDIFDQGEPPQMQREPEDVGPLPSKGVDEEQMHTRMDVDDPFSKSAEYDNIFRSPDGFKKPRLSDHSLDRVDGFRNSSEPKFQVQEPFRQNGGQQTHRSQTATSTITRDEGNEPKPSTSTPKSGNPPKNTSLAPRNNPPGSESTDPGGILPKEMEDKLKFLQEGMAVLTDAVMKLNQSINK